MTSLREAFRFRARAVALGRVVAWPALSAAGCLFTSQAAFGGIYCREPNLTIASPGTVSDDLIIGDHFAITDLNVKIVASHGWVSDVSFTLEKTAGDSAAIAGVTLVDRVGIPGSDCMGPNFDLILDDEADNGPVESQCESPLGAGGPYTPNSPLSAFDGVDVGGTWRLSVSDAFVNDGGT